jgi:AraC-like DNA-binding protein
VDIMEENQNLLAGAHNCADAYLSLLLVECLRELGSPALDRRAPPSPQDSAAKARIDQCIQYIGEYFAEELTLDRLAEELSVSPWHLSHIFSRHTGTTISAYITDVRMRRAADLVTGTHQPLKEIASRVGYSDEFYFSKVFKRHFGLPPGAFRRTMAAR